MDDRVEPDEDILKLTVLLQGKTLTDQIGYHTAFTSAVESGALDWYQPIPYRDATSAADWRSLFDTVIEQMRATGSDALFLQFFHGRSLPDPADFIARVRALPTTPIVATSCGDGFGPIGARPPISLVSAAALSDLTFSTSMGKLARRLGRAGARNITLMPHGACDVRFGQDHLSEGPRANEFDVVFVGNRPGGRNPSRYLYWSGRQRLRYVSALTRRYGARFGIFGRGWSGHPGWQGPIPFNEQLNASQRGAVVFGGYPGSNCDYYTSNRAFIAALGNAPIVDYWGPRTETFLKPGEDWELVRSPKGATIAIDRLIEDQAAAAAMAASASRNVRQRHMESHRVRLIIRYLHEFQAARRRGMRPSMLECDFFHSDVDADAEAEHAFHEW